MGKDIILHLGMPKAASTYLQEDVFPYVNEIYCANGDRNVGTPLGELQKKIAFENHLFLDIEQEKQKIYEYINSLEQDKILFSNENLFGSYFDNFRDHKNFANILKQIFPDARVFVIFRKQDEWLESAYAQTLFLGFSEKIDDFMNYRKSEFQGLQNFPFHKIGVNVNNLDWTVFLENYFNLFGRENVLALPQELLKNNEKEFLNRFYDFFNISERYFPTEPGVRHKKYSLISSRIALTINKFLNSRQKVKLRRFLQDGLDKMLYIKYDFIHGYTRKQIMNLHKESNKKLADMMGLDLSQYGYY